MNAHVSFYRYFMGQLCEIAEKFYSIDELTVHVLDSKNDADEENKDGKADSMEDAKEVVVTYRLNFDNRDYVSQLNFYFSNNKN